MFKQTSVIRSVFLLAWNVPSKSAQGFQIIHCVKKSSESTLIRGVKHLVSGKRLTIGFTRAANKRKRQIPPLALHPWEKRACGLSRITLVLLNWQAVNVQTVIGSAAVWSFLTKEEGFYINKSLVCWCNRALSLFKIRLSLVCDIFLKSCTAPPVIH